MRKLIGALVVIMILAACSTPAEEPVLEEPIETASGRVEVFSWWTAGGEAEGFEAMVRVLAEEHPDVDLINAAIAGGTGTNARAVLATRLEAGTPPDSWQVHAGQGLIGTHAASGQLEPLNDLYEQNGWFEVMPPPLIEVISQDGNIYSVPVNIHRANVIWYNPAVLQANDLDVPQTWDAFFAAAETLDAAGITPIAMGEQWTALHLFETVLLGTMSVEEYNALWTGELSWESQQVTEAIDTFGRLLAYTNEDAASLSWDQAAQAVADGDAAFTVMGDWAEGYFRSQDLVVGEDYDWVLVPGTEGVFQFLSDSFVLSVGAENREGALAFLTVAGSREGQEAFSPVKGSICARTDCNHDLFGPYLQEAMADWAADTVVGSLTHGVVAADPWRAAIDEALGVYLADGDGAAFQNGLAGACAAEGPCE
ncbi:MAG: carbohydrate ABC transporter substrate-binding protein [Chloroflexi bacterium]|nr:carbohydrate ABC transporter substrate-binding protein [Chloroflexota bacterium]